MKAHWYETVGDVRAVLEFGEMDDPFPGPGEVRVKVAFSGVNPYDTKKRKGGHDVEKFGRIIPDCDGSGFIDQVGDGVSKDRIGQPVWIFGAQVSQAFGTAAEYCVVPDLQAINLSKNMSLEEGAAIGIPAVTAHRAVFADGDVLGKTIYVAGATGRVGSYAVQFSKQAGATVVAATGSSDKIDELKQLGADFVVNYKDEDRIQQVM
ncbi:MAG: zinc-binding dehydrogenase, partial [Hyphomicrobiales bacterium]|nr:zinc-binding dehydrogenase [Hyphomicrobiales bacterium]